MMTDNIFMRMLLNDKVKLEPAFLSKRYKDELLRRLKLKLEGTCSRHGYIKPNSIEIHKVCMGRVELVSLNGTVQYDVAFYADICNPLIGSVIRSKVVNVNKFGILAEAEGVVEIIIAKNSVAIQSEVDVNKIRIGDDILVEVVGKKFELNDKKISLIARVVKDAKRQGQSIDTNSDDEEEDELQDGGENNEKEDEEEEEEEENGSDDSKSDITSSDKHSDSSSVDGTESELSDGLEGGLDGNFFSDEEGDDLDEEIDGEGSVEEGDDVEEENYDVGEER
jgi:DNA-directed RNA polymerase subunit E'/Rpb7